jgi:TatD DNase family protein
MTPFLIDTHAHLDAEIYKNDLDVVLKHAREDGIAVVTVGNDYASSKRAVEIAERYPEGVFAAVGMHPLNVSPDDPLRDLEKFSALARHPKVVAIGETGLDFHDLPGRRSPEAARAERIRVGQVGAFNRFLELSKELRLPILLHCRDAESDMLPLLERWDKMTPGFDARGIVHCFSGDWKTAKRFYNLGFVASVTGIVSQGHYQTELIRKSPLSQLVLESDCPFLTTMPWSIRRSEPSYLATIAATVAGIRGQSVAEVARQTTENALRILKRISGS